MKALDLPVYTCQREKIMSSSVFFEINLEIKFYYLNVLTINIKHQKTSYLIHLKLALWYCNKLKKRFSNTMDIQAIPCLFLPQFLYLKCTEENNNNKPMILNLPCLFILPSCLMCSYSPLGTVSVGWSFCPRYPPSPAALLSSLMVSLLIPTFIHLVVFLANQIV